MFTERELRKGLKTKVFGHKIYTFQTIDSTNNCAKAVASIGAREGIVVIAEEQKEGRGRLGRSWLANPGENLMFSLLLRPNVRPDAINLLPLYVAVAAAQAIEKTTGLKVECKWPNDLLVNKKKIAGILLEGSVQNGVVDYIVIGLGINVNQMQFPNDLLQKATSLKLELHKEIDRPSLFKEILSSLEIHYRHSASTGFESVLPFWSERSTMLNKSILVSQAGNVSSGIVKGLTRDGGLILQTAGAERTFFAGDVTILGETPEQLLPLSSGQPSAVPVAQM
jgi:BirA family biotin operon repressor/biotin-[acetyl-CoA-carboxylase] ligase